MTKPRLSAAKSPSARERRGAVLALALIVFLLCVTILCTLLQSVVNHERQVRDRRQIDQAAWLADAGINRAAAQLRQSASYRGETWNVSADELGGAASGKVTIEVKASDQQSAALHVTAQADYPDDAVHRIRQSRETTIHLK